jgi:DNA-binding response OmpR family regulator
MSRVLVIDDDVGILPLVEMCLDALDVDVVLASRLAAALALSRAEPVGLVLLDLSLGDEDGLVRGVPIVAFTAHDSRKHEAITSGVDSFIRRPFAPADLRATVERFLVPTPSQPPGQTSAH